MNNYEHKRLVVREKVALTLVFLLGGLLVATGIMLITPPFTASMIEVSLVGLLLVSLAYSVHLCIVRGIDHAEWHDENDHR